MKYTQIKYFFFSNLFSQATRSRSVRVKEPQVADPWSSCSVVGGFIFVSMLLIQV